MRFIFGHGSAGEVGGVGDNTCRIMCICVHLLSFCPLAIYCGHFLLTSQLLYSCDFGILESMIMSYTMRPVRTCYVLLGEPGLAGFIAVNAILDRTMEQRLIFLSRRAG